MAATAPKPAFPVTASDAFDLAAWWTRYATDRLGETDHAGIRGHAAVVDTHQRAIDHLLHINDEMEA